MASLKKRLALAAATATTVGAVTTLVAGFTFGLFSATESSGANTFTAGTVTVGTTTPASVTCTVTVLPGDSSTGAPIDSTAAQQCTYNVQYTGTANAWLAVDMTVANGTPALFSSGSATGLQFYLKDSTSTYVTSTATDTGGGGTTYTQQGGTSAPLPATGISNLLVSTSEATTGQVVNFKLDYALPLDTGNTYNTSPTAASVTVTLTFHAVQASNNALPGTCAAGAQCNAGGGFAWS